MVLPESPPRSMPYHPECTPLVCSQKLIGVQPRGYLDGRKSLSDCYDDICSAMSCLSVPPETSLALHARPGLGIHQEHPAEEKRHHMDPQLEWQERQGCLTQLAQ